MFLLFMIFFPSHSLQRQRKLSKGHHDRQFTHLSPLSWSQHDISRSSLFLLTGRTQVHTHTEEIVSQSVRGSITLTPSTRHTQTAVSTLLYPVLTLALQHLGVLSVRQTAVRGCSSAESQRHHTEAISSQNVTHCHVRLSFHLLIHGGPCPPRPRTTSEHTLTNPLNQAQINTTCIRITAMRNKDE